MNAHSRNRRLNRNDPTDFYQLFFLRNHRYLRGGFVTEWLQA